MALAIEKKRDGRDSGKHHLDVSSLLATKLRIFLVSLAFLAATYFIGFLGLAAAFLLSGAALGFALDRLTGAFKPLHPPARPAAWLVAGTIVFTQVANAVSLVFGYTKEMIFALFVLVIAVLAYSISKNPISKFEKIEFSRAFNRHRNAYLFSFLVFLVVFGILAYSSMRPIDGGYANGGWNWSDYLVHYSVIKTVNNGIFPPQTPFFAGKPLIYDWFADFHAAILAKYAGGYEILITSAQIGLFAAALSLLAYFLAFSLVNNRRAAFFAAVICIFGGGLGYTRLAGDLLAGNGSSITSLVSSESYDNSWSAGAGPFRIPSLFGTGILAHRSTAIGLPAFVLAIMLLLYAMDETGKTDPKSARRAIVTAGLLTALVTPFRYFAFFSIIAGALVLAVSTVVKTLVERISSRNSSSLLTGFFGAVKAVAPFFILSAAGILFLLPALQQSDAAKQFKLNLGWEAPKDSAESFVFFYAANFGVPLLLAAGGFLFAGVRRRRALFFKATVLFLIPNLVSFTAIGWDMNKFFQYMWVLLSIFAGAALAKLSWKLSIPLTALSVLSTVLVALWFGWSTTMALSGGELAAAQWITRNTPADAVFATRPFINMPTDYAGRLRLLTFTPYVSNWGFDPSERERDLRTIYCGNESESASFMKKYGASYLIDAEWDGDCSHAYRSSSYFSKAYDEAGVAIFKLVGTPPLNFQG